MPLPSFLQFLGPSATASGYAKADLARRFGAAALDGLAAAVVALLLSILGRPLGVQGAFFGLGLLLGAAYFAVRDGLAHPRLDHRSLGKQILGLRPVRLDGLAMSLKTSARRNATLAAAFVVFGLAYLAEGVGLTHILLANTLVYLSWLAALLAAAEAVLVVTDKEGRRIGDKYAGTQVIEREV